MEKTIPKRSRVIDLAPYRSSIATVAAALALAVIIELFNHRSFLSAAKFIFLRPHLFFLNFIIILFTLSFSLLFRKRKAVLILLSCLWFTLGLTDFIMRFFRVTPFAATDIALLESVWSVMLVYLKIWHIVLIGVGLLALIFGFVVIFVKAKKEKTDFKTAACMISASSILLLLLILTYHMTGILPSHFSNLPDAYSDYGFPYCFSVGIFDRGIDRPEGYSKESVEDILDSIGATRKPDSSQKPDIIFVQLESFFDINYVYGITFSENPVPNFTSLKAKCSNGFLSVPSIGSGTANTEFEIITGMSLDYFGTAEYPYKTVMQDTTCETICYNLKEQGYSCHAIHNHTGSFYDRNLVFSNFGFDTFTSIEYMQNVTENPIGWANDSVLTGEILGALDSTEEQDLVYAISVQAHGRYPRESIGDYEPIKVYGEEDEGRATAIQYYANQLCETDAFIGELVSELEKRDTPVILVMYGDHLPSLDLTEEELTCGSLYQTEYVIWTNCETDREVKDLDAAQLSAYVFGKAGFSNGIFTKLHQNYSDSENYYDALEMLEYDVLYGYYNAYNGKQKYQPTNLRMGYKEITVSYVSEEDGILKVKGENFTPFSVIIVGGRKYRTEFIDSSTLVTSEPYGDIPEGGAECSVAQITRNGEMLSEVVFTKTEEQKISEKSEKALDKGQN